jgi:hypothetical protein
MEPDSNICALCDISGSKTRLEFARHLFQGISMTRTLRSGMNHSVCLVLVRFLHTGGWNQASGLLALRLPDPSFPSRRAASVY